MDEFGRPVPNSPAEGHDDTPVRNDPSPALPSPDACLEALAYAQGNPALAAERLDLPGTDGASLLLGILALDESIHPRAQAILRFMQLAKLLGALQYVENTLLEHLEAMEPKDIAKTYTSMVLAAELLTKAATSTTPSTQAAQNSIVVNLLRVLPAEVRDAMRVLLPPELSAPDPLLVMPGSASTPTPVRSDPNHAWADQSPGAGFTTTPDTTI